jgi:hypothetical protein
MVKCEDCNCLVQLENEDGWGEGIFMCKYTLKRGEPYTIHWTKERECESFKPSR